MSLVEPLGSARGGVLRIRFFFLDDRVDTGIQNTKNGPFGFLECAQPRRRLSNGIFLNNGRRQGQGDGESRSENAPAWRQRANLRFFTDPFQQVGMYQIVKMNSKPKFVIVHATALTRTTRHLFRCSRHNEEGTYLTRSRCS